MPLPTCSVAVGIMFLGMCFR